MIRLDIADYCGECEDFTPSVEKPSKMFSNSGETVIMTDTVISCSNQKRCEAIKRYLERRGQQDD